MIALERKKELDEEVKTFDEHSPNAESQENLYNDIRLDNEVSKIIYQKTETKTKPTQKHHKSTAVQESTEFGTDGNTARISIKPHFESMEQNFPTSDSREVILHTQTIGDSLQNDDLSAVKPPHQSTTEEVHRNEELLNFIGELMSAESVPTEEIITEIEKQVLIENKDFEDELMAIKKETERVDRQTREYKKQKYCVVWPSKDGPDGEKHKDQLIDKHFLEEQFLEICKDVRKEVLKTRFINGLPSVDTQMGYLNNIQNSTTRSGQDNNIQGILDMVVTNDDLLNKFYDVIFNSDNQALKLPSVSKDDNKL